MPTESAPSLPAQDVFSDQADRWWDPHGPMRMLHEIMPVRCAYLSSLLGADDPLPLKGRRVLDVGCGGGLMSEALARLGAEVTGLDINDRLLGVAREHAAANGLSIDYRSGDMERVLQEDCPPFDVILAFEVLEHVLDKASFINKLSAHLQPEGWLVLSSMNRTKRSFLLGLVMAEYVLRWVPAGTHDWELFVTPSELKGLLESAGLKPKDLTGMVYNPLMKKFILQKGRTGVNYFMTAQKTRK